MRRRDFVMLLGGTVAWPLAVRAQQPGRVRHIGVLMNGAESDPDASTCVTAFHEALQQAGWTVGRNLRIDTHWSAGEVGATHAAAADLLRLAPDVIVTDGRPGLEALRRAGRTVPIVFMGINKPVFYGFVDRLARPGHNMTGFTGLEPSMGATWLELLTEIAPHITRVAVVFNAATAPSAVEFSRSAETIAQKVSVSVFRSTVYEPADIEAVMATLARDPGGGLIFPVDAFTEMHRQLIVEAAARARLPAIYGARTFAVAGGLASYGIDLPAQFRQVASYVNRILRGEKPADLPVRQPTKFELVINRRTANALGLTVPQTLLDTADEVIE